MIGILAIQGHAKNTEPRLILPTQHKGLAQGRAHKQTVTSAVAITETGGGVEHIRIIKRTVGQGACGRKGPSAQILIDQHGSGAGIK